MSKRCHTLFINLVILVLPLSSAKKNFLKGSQCIFFIPLHQPASFLCLCLCLPEFHKSSPEMFLFCVSFYPLIALLNKNRLTCCEKKTWCMATPSSLTLSTSIMQAIDFSGEESECVPSQGKLDHLGNTPVHISCHTASVHWDQMWSESCSW